MKRLIFLLAAILAPVPLAFAQWTPEILWDHSGETTRSHYGSHVFALGDQNDDGFADWGVVSQGAAGFDSVYARVDLYHGGNPPSTIPFRSYQGGQGVGTEISTGDAVGDLNGDGYVDWMIWKRYSPVYHQYTVEFYYGGPDTLVDTRMTIPTGEYMLNGDVNGDGYSDLYKWHGPYSEFYYGSPVFDTIPDWSISPSIESPDLAFATSFGDLNGDGYCDYVGDDIPDGLHVVFGGYVPDTIPDVIWTNYTDYPAYLIRDLNNDEFDELATGTLSSINMHMGGPAFSQTPNIVLSFEGCDGGADKYVSVGDVNDDGFQDFAAVSWFCNNHWGKAALYLGYAWLNPDPILIVSGRSAPLYLVGIGDIVGLGDVNGDGVDDFAIGATNDDNDGTRGRVVVISGNPDIEVRADEPPFVAQDFHVEVYPNPFNSAATITLDVPLGVREVSLRLFNTLGQQVLEERVAAWGSNLTYRLDASGIASGVYFLHVAAGSSQKFTKLVALK